MKPHYEHVHLSPGDSWTLYVRRAESLPFLWHYHPEFELTLLENAAGHRYVGDSLQPFESGDLVCIGPNQPHCWSAEMSQDGVTPITAVVVWFSSRWIENAIGCWPEFAPLNQLCKSAGRGIRFSKQIIDSVRPRILALEQQEPALRLGSLFQILVELANDREATMLSSHAVATQTHRAESRLAAVLQRIHADIRATPSAEELAEVAALSTGAFHRFFRRHMGVTVLEYVRQIRIGTACQILIGSDQPIGLIAEEVGIRNLAHFNRQFMHNKGLTPSQFRRLHRR